MKADTKKTKLTWYNLHDNIKRTKTFMSLSRPVQKVFLSRTNVKKILHALNVISNIGFEEWERISNYQPRTVEVIKELI